MSTLGEKLKQLRNNKRLTQKELASLIGETRDNIANWETGRATPSLETVAKFAHFFNIRVDDLMDFSQIIIQMADEKGMSEKIKDEALKRYNLAKGKTEKSKVANELNTLIEELPLEDLKLLKITAEHLNKVKKKYGRTICGGRVDNVTPFYLKRLG